MSMKHHPLTKFLVLSVVSFCIGTMHGMLQVMPPVRHWLDSIGSPFSGPGHMIDPLAHAHMNLVGGVVLLAMGVTYYLLPILTGRAIRSARLVEFTFWFTAIGCYAFYIIQMGFGIGEGMLLLSAPADIEALHRYYGPAVAVSGIVMAAGFFCYLANIALTLRPAGTLLFGDEIDRGAKQHRAQQHFQHVRNSGDSALEVRAAGH